MNIFKNENKNPNELHLFLINNECVPINLRHNAIYNEDGEKVKEATRIYIDIEQGKEQLLNNLVESFMQQ